MTTQVSLHPSPEPFHGESGEQFIRPDGEPEPVCHNCDCFEGGRCLNRRSIWFTFDPKPHDGCEHFFPDHKRWPEADHG